MREPVRWLAPPVPEAVAMARPRRAAPFRGIAVGVVLLLLGSAPYLPARAAGPVWEVVGDHGRLLLAGTVHVLRPRDLPLPAALEAAWGEADRLVLEIDLAASRSPAIDALIRRRGFYAEDEGLPEVLAPATWAAVRAFCEVRGIDPARLARMRPGLAMLTLTRVELDRLGAVEAGVDERFFRRARAEGLPWTALESAHEQLELLLGLGAERPDALLRATLDDLERAAASLDALVAAWRAGDLPALERLVLVPLRREFPAIFERLFTGRNAAWLVQLEALTGRAGVTLVLVGAGHLAGEEGLVAALRRAGYRVERYRPEPEPQVAG